MSTDKLSELKDVADYWRKVKSGELPAPGPNEISITACTLDGAVSRISALLAELEASSLQCRGIEQERELFRLERTAHQLHAQALEQRIAELERANQSQDDHINQQQDRIDSLEKTNASLGRGLAAAEKRLATPVQLPPPAAWMRGDDKTTFGPIFTKNKEYAESQWGGSAIALYSVPVGIKEAAFSDERNLMHINERGRETSLIWNKNNSENGDVQLFRLVGFTVEGDE